MTLKDKETALQYKKQLIELGIPFENMLVFGSRATGKANKWSDLDICVISPLFGVDRIADRALLMNIGRKVSDIIEAHPMTKDSFNDKFNPLANEVRKFGTII